MRIDVPPELCPILKLDSLMIRGFFLIDYFIRKGTCLYGYLDVKVKNGS